MIALIISLVLAVCVIGSMCMIWKLIHKVSHLNSQLGRNSRHVVNVTHLHKETGRIYL